MDFDWTYLLVLALVFPVCYLSGFLHEVGHALMGWRCGFIVTSFGMGLGKPFWVGRWGTTRIYLGRSKPFQGLTFLFAPALFPSRSQSAGMLAGGIMVNTVMTLVGVALWWLLPWLGWLWLTIAAVNGLMAIVNAVPFSVRAGQTVLRSDGGMILQVLRNRGFVTPPPQRIQMAKALRGLWESVGDLTGLWAHWLDAVLAWRELEDKERCRQLLAEAEALPIEHVPGRRAFGQMVRAVVLAETGDRAEAETALAEAEQSCRALDLPGLSLVLEWLRADHCLRTGDVAAADAA